VEFNRREESFKKGINYFSGLSPRERLSFLGSTDKFMNEVPQNDDTKALVEEIQNVDLPQYFYDPDSFNEIYPLEFRDPFRNSLYIDWNRIIWWIMMRNVCKYKDWHSEGKMTPVKNQASCGSCWAFASIGLVEAMNKIQLGINYDLSEQELVDCDSTNSGCSGGNMYRALTYVKNNKIYSESVYPYVAIDQTCSTIKSPKYTIKTLDRTPVRNTKAFINQLCKSPETVYFYVADDFFDYTSGIYDGAGCAGQTGVNHGVIAVGHDIYSSTPYEKFKNSWGN
jgi:C1A family cysteine protease